MPGGFVIGKVALGLLLIASIMGCSGGEDSSVSQPAQVGATPTNVEKGTVVNKPTGAQMEPGQADAVNAEQNSK
jgi:hypothetical protein